MNKRKMDQDMDVVRFMDHWTTRTIGTRRARTKLSDVEQDSIRGRPQQQDLRQRTADAYHSVS